MFLCVSKVTSAMQFQKIGNSYQTSHKWRLSQYFYFERYSKHQRSTQFIQKINFSLYTKVSSCHFKTLHIFISGKHTFSLFMSKIVKYDRAIVCYDDANALLAMEGKELKSLALSLGASLNEMYPADSPTSCQQAHSA